MLRSEVVQSGAGSVPGEESYRELISKRYPFTDRFNALIREQPKTKLSEVQRDELIDIYMALDVQFGPESVEQKKASQMQKLENEKHRRQLDCFANFDVETEKTFLDEMRQKDFARFKAISKASASFKGLCREKDTQAACVMARTNENITQADFFNGLCWAIKNYDDTLVRCIVDELGLPLKNYKKISYAIHDAIQWMRYTDHILPCLYIIRSLYNGYHALDVDVRRFSDGFTPLCVACERGYATLAFEFINLGCDVNILTKTHETAFSLAQKTREHPDTITDERQVLINILAHSGARAPPGKKLQPGWGA
eukprot:gene731-138_t